MSAALPGSIGSAANSVGSHLRELAEPIQRGEKIQQIIERAARRAGLSYWRAYNIWFGKARRIEEHERVRIAEALDKRRKEVTRNELHDLRSRLARLEALLVQADEEFHRPQLDPLRSPDGGLGGIRGAVAGGRGAKRR
jgi:hypothetical protein